MKKRFFAGLTLALTVLFSFGLLSAADKTTTPERRKGKTAAMIEKLLPPELHRSLNLIPEDAIAVGFINAEVITKGKLFSEVLKSIGMDWNALLAATGGKKEDTDACTLFYVKLAPADAKATAMPALEVGGAIVCKYASTVREQFGKSVEELRKGMDELDPNAKSDVKVEKIKVEDRDAILVSIPSQNVTVLSIAAGKNVIQFRCFLNFEPVKALIPARGEVTSLAASLNLKSAFAVAIDGARILTMLGEIAEDPTLKTIRIASCSVNEKKNGLAIVLRIASNMDGVQQIKAQIEAALNGLKEDITLGSVVSKTSVTVENGTDVVVRSFIPSELILQNLQVYQEMNSASAESQSEPAAK